MTSSSRFGRRLGRRTAAAALAAAATLTTGAVASPAHADNVYHACRLVNGVQQDGPLPLGWTAQPCIYLDYDRHTAQAIVDFHGGSTDVHLIAEIGYDWGDGNIEWGQGQFISADRYPVGSGTIREWSNNITVPDGVALVYARARLKEASIGIAGDVESGSIPPSW